jgi:hypothetical protein
MRDIWIMSERLGLVHLLQLIYYQIRLQCNVNRKDEHQPKYHVSAREWGFYVQKLYDFIRVHFVMFLVTATLHHFTTRLIDLFQNGVNLSINIGHIKLLYMHLGL